MRDGLALQGVGQLRTGQADGLRQDERAAGEQGHRHIGDRRVEVRRDGLEDPAARGEREPLDVVGRQIGQGGVRDHHALRLTGGAGGVDRVRRMPRQQRSGPLVLAEVAGRQIADGGGQFVRSEHRRGDRARRGRHRGVRRVRRSGGQHQHRPDVGQQTADARRRQARVQRHVGRTGLGHREQADQPLGRRRTGDRDPLTGTGAACGQQAGDPVGAGVQLRVREVAARRGHGGRGRCAGRLRLEEVRQRRGRGRVPPVVAGRQQRTALRGGERIGPAEPGAGPLGHGPQQLGEPAHQPLAVGHHIGAVVQPDVQPLADQRGRQAQRIVRGVAQFGRGDLDRGRGAVRGGETAGGDRIVLEHRCRVEEFTDAGQPLDVGEAEVLVRQQRQLLRLDAVQQVVERLLGPERHAHRQGVDEETDHGLDAVDLRRAAGDGRAEGHVVAAGQTAEQDRPGRLDQGVERDAQLPSGRDQFGRERGRQVGLQTLRTRRSTVGGPCQQRRLVQPVQRRAPRPLGRLPVLDGQPGQIVAVRRDARQLVAAPGVAGGHLGQEHRHGPAVQQQMVVGHHEPVVPGVEPDQREADQRRPGRVEARLLLAGQDPLQRGGLVGLGKRAQVM